MKIKSKGREKNEQKKKKVNDNFYDYSDRDF